LKHFSREGQGSFGFLPRRFLLFARIAESPSKLGQIFRALSKLGQRCVQTHAFASELTEIVSLSDLADSRSAQAR